MHVQRTYPALTTNLRDCVLQLMVGTPTEIVKDGRTSQLVCKGIGMSILIHGLQPSAMEALAKVTPVPRLCHDLCCLKQLVSTATPPLHYLHSRHINTANYCFGNASGNGLGSYLSQGN